MRIAMLGLGSMNGAILKGLLASGVSAQDVVATTRSAASARARAEELGIEVVAEESVESERTANQQAVASADLVMLGVKPHQITDLCTEIADALEPDAVVVSVAAAVTVDMLQQALPQGQPVIRSMPNTPLSVGRGVVGLAAGEHTSAQQLHRVRDLLSACGAVHVVEETQIDALTGVSGSGPAYVFFLAEHLAAAGAERGLPPELAADLAAQTIQGAGDMLVSALSQGAGDAASLRQAVTSPNGTTERGIAALTEGGLPQAVHAAVSASAARAAEISRDLAGE